MSGLSDTRQDGGTTCIGLELDAMFFAICACCTSYNRVPPRTPLEPMHIASDVSLAMPQGNLVCLNLHKSEDLMSDLTPATFVVSKRLFVISPFLQKSTRAGVFL